MVANLNQRPCFSAEVATPDLRPDLLLWSSSSRTVYIIELTVPWEAAVEEAFGCKSLKYIEQQLTRNNVVEKPNFRWKLAGEALWANRPSGYLKIWGFDAKRSKKPSKPLQVRPVALVEEVRPLLGLKGTGC